MSQRNGKVMDIVLTVLMAVVLPGAAALVSIKCGSDLTNPQRTQHLRFSDFPLLEPQPDARATTRAAPKAQARRGKCDPPDTREWRELAKVKVPEGGSINDYRNIPDYDFCLTIRCNAERPEEGKRLLMAPSNPIIPAGRWILICGPK